jgi:ubiquinone/menaquinone biosynthesis C-methylase UbiE
VALLGLAGRRSRRLSIVAIDHRPEVLAAAVRAMPSVATIEGLELHVGDGRSLPYPDRSFDVAHASLVLHHFPAGDSIGLLREMARVARLGVVVNDLERSRLGWLGAWLLGHLLTANRYTRHDAPLSVRRAYRSDEMAAMLRDAGLVPVRTLRGAFGQRYAIAALPGSSWSIDGEGADPAGPRGAGE